MICKLVRFIGTRRRRGDEYGHVSYRSTHEWNEQLTNGTKHRKKTSRNVRKWWPDLYGVKQKKKQLASGLQGLTLSHFYSWTLRQRSLGRNQRWNTTKENGVTGYVTQLTAVRFISDSFAFDLNRLASPTVSGREHPLITRAFSVR